MALAAVKFHSYTEAVNRKLINWQTDTFKLMLSNSAPTASTAVSASDISEISAGNGYSAGGATVTIGSEGQTSGTYKAVANDVTITASGGSIATFRYLVLVDTTANRVVQYYDFGSSVVITAGNSFIADFDATNGVYQFS